jgi:hypothetical protein
MAVLTSVAAMFSRLKSRIVAVGLERDVIVQLPSRQ